MRRLIRFLVLLMIVAFVASATAQQERYAQAPTPLLAQSAPENEGKPRIEKFLGVIEKVDEVARTIEVKGKVKKEEKLVTFPIDENIRITRGGKEMSLAELKRGMTVSVEYRRDKDKAVAVSVKVAAPKAGPRKEQPDT